MSVDPSTPVLIGWHAVSRRDRDPGDGKEAVELMVDAARGALGGLPGAAVDWIGATAGLTRYADPARLVGEWIGADGAHSTVRKALGLSFDGGAFAEQYMLGDVEVDWSVPGGYVLRSMHQTDGITDDLLVAIPLPGRGRYRMAMLVPDELRPSEAVGDDVAHGLGAGGGLLCHHHCCPRLDDAGLLAGDSFGGFAEYLRVVESDDSDHIDKDVALRPPRRRENICRIEAATEPRLDHHCVHAVVCEKGEPGCGEQFENGAEIRLLSSGGGGQARCDAGNQPRKGIGRNGSSIDAQALAVAFDVWRRV